MTVRSIPVSLGHTQRLKLIRTQRTHGSGVRFYDLERDPAERADLARTPARPRARRWLEKNLRGYRRYWQKDRGFAETLEVAQRTEEKLRALGYVD